VEEEPSAPVVRKPKADDGKETDFDVDVAAEEEKAQGKDVAGAVDLSTPINPREPWTRYKFPTLDLLKKYDTDGRPYVDNKEQESNKNRIISVLLNFGVEIDSIRATVGPTITLYEITPKPGVRISKIKNLEDDIALSLAALGIRIIAPMPGKGTIGIEVPNANPNVVSMLSILNSKKFQEAKMELPLALGKTITNEVFMVDLAKIPHLLVAGATGQGKSVGMNAIITSLLYKKHPNELKFVLVDPKKVEFSVYAPIADHFMAALEENEDEPIITDTQKVVKTLKGLCVLMDNRYDLLKKAGARNIKEYNAKYLNHKLNPNDGHEFMPYIVAIVDEFADLIMTAGKEVEMPITRIAQLARAVGIHMVIATQRPSTKVITGGIKANFPGRIAFKVAQRIDSSIILDRTGAHQLIGRGDMLYSNGGEPVRVQCAFVDTPEVERINEFVANQPGPRQPLELPEPLSEDGGGVGGGSVDAKSLDPLFEEAARHIVVTQQGSTSMVQRRFSIGYNRAGRLMDQLEQAGIVGAAMGSKPREVLISDEVSLDNLLATLR
jgi:S-DNA-T family DNA segregation ATPase FtsK/SpoIIIE